MRGIRLNCCAALLLLAITPAQAGRTDWREMSVGHFHLYSTLSDSNTRNVARQLQAFENTVGELLRGEDRLPDVPTLIYILNSHDFQQYAVDRPGLAGFFADRPYVNLIAIDGDLPFDQVRITVFHEYTHYIQRNSNTMQYPPWYMEGYAELYSSFRLKDDMIELGNVPEGLRISMQDWIPLERLLAVTQDDPEYRTENLMPQFYGESWALVHMLLFDDHALTAATETYLDNMDSGLPEPEAFKVGFSYSKADLDKALHDLIRKRLIHLKRVKFLKTAAIDEAPVTKMTQAEADAQMARLTFAFGRPQNVVAPLLAEALKSGPEDPRTRALQARIAAHTDHPIDLAGLAAPLARGGTGDVQQRIDVADALLRGSEAKESATTVLAVLGDLVHAETPPLEAVALWSEAAERSDLKPVEIIDVLMPASARAPHDTRLLATLAWANEILGEKSKARGYYNRIIRVSNQPAERLWAQKQADSERLQNTGTGSPH